MRCLILIALSLALACATYPNKNRFDHLLRGYGGFDQQDQIDDYDTEYQPRRRLGGLHDIIGQGLYPGQEEGECSPWDQDQCEQDEFDDDQEPRGRQQFGQRYGDESEDEMEFGQYRQGSNSQYRKYKQCLLYGKCGQVDPDEIYGQQTRYDQDKGQYGDYENEIDEIGYGIQSQSMSTGRCHPNPRVLPKLENMNCHLATGLYKQARRERDDKNIVVSPTAVLLGLGALNIGAKGHTKKEIGLVSGVQPTINGLSALIRMLKKGAQSIYGQEFTSMGGQGCMGGQCTQIKPFTGIFLSQTTPVQRQFMQTVQGCLGVKVNKCDFQRHPQQCRQQINRWVSQKTQHKMPRLLPQDSVTDNTKMLVVSGLQLKAKWGKQFKNHHTTRGVFHPLDTEMPKTVPMMQKRGLFKYHEDDTVKVLGIPTEGNEVTLFVILPKCKKCLLDVEKEQLLEGDQLKRLLDNCDQKKQKVDVKLPKFQIKHKIDAKRTLLNKGMANMCEQKTADFSGITGCMQCSQKAQDNLRRPIGQRNQMDGITQRAQIHLNKFLTQATIKVTDSGITTVGSQHQFQGQNMYENDEYPDIYGQSSFEDEMDENDHDQTSMTGRDRFDEIMGSRRRFGQGLNKKSFHAKHPFAFVVRHNPSKQMLLIGRVIDAGQKQTGTPTMMGGRMEEIYPSNQFGREF